MQLEVEVRRRWVEHSPDALEPWITISGVSSAPARTVYGGSELQHCIAGEAADRLATAPCVSPAIWWPGDACK